MFTQRTAEISRKLLAFVHVAAYLADPGHFSGLWRSRRRFDILLIISVSGGRVIGQFFSGNDVGDEHRVGAEVNALYDLCGNVRVRAFCDIENAVVCSFCCGVAVELVHIPAALESEMFKGIKACLFGQDRDIEFAGALDHAVGIIGFIYRQGNPKWGVGNLCGSVGDASVVLVAFSGSDNKQTIS